MRVVVVPVLSDNYSLCSQELFTKNYQNLQMVCVNFQISCVWCQSFWISKKCRRSCVFFCFCYAKNGAEIPVDRWWEKDRSMCGPSGGEHVSEWSFRHRMPCSQLPYEGAHCLSESQGGKGRDCGSQFLRVWRKGTAPVQNDGTLVSFLQFDKLFSQQILWGSHNSPSYGSCWRQCRDGEAGGGPTSESSNQRPPTRPPDSPQVPSVKVYGGRIDKVAACTNPLEWGGGFFDWNLQGDRLQIPSPNFQWKKQMDCCL